MGGIVSMRAALAFLALALVSAAVAPAAAEPWRITKDHWSDADEKGFGAFVQALGETDCSSSESCLRNPANPYRNTDQHFLDIDVDCAKLHYLLRAYYAWKNNLPFSYVDAVSGEGGDLRYTKTANRAVGRHDVVGMGHLQLVFVTLDLAAHDPLAAERQGSGCRRSCQLDMCSPL